jgi:nucleotide-binding universal stress UspA family protein
MIQLNRILVPVDFSEFSRAAVDYACAIAARFGSELHLLHVVPDPAMLVPEAAAFSVESMQSQSEALVKDAERQLAELPGGGWENGRPVLRVVRTGAAFIEIIDYAQSLEVDLIVVGTHGRSGLMHVLMGSVAERVVQKAPCPVLSVKPVGHQFVVPEPVAAAQG